MIEGQILQIDTILLLGILLDSLSECFMTQTEQICQNIRSGWWSGLLMETFSRSQDGIKIRGTLSRGDLFSLWVSHISVCIISKHTDYLCSGLSFWGCLHSELFWKTELVYPSRIKNKFPIALEDRDNVSLPSKGQSCFLPSILKCLPLGLRADLLSVHYKRLGFPNLRLFLQKCDPLHV